MTVLAVLAWAGVVAIHPFDAAVVRAVGHSLLPPLVVLRDITNVGKSFAYLIAAFSVALVVSLIEWERLGKKARARLALIYSQSAFAFASIALSGVLANILKVLVGRARPKLLSLYGPDYREALHASYDFASFPSGHSTTLGAIAAVLSLWFPRWRIPIFGVSLVLAFSRCAADAHYPSDVWGGFCFGFLFTLFLARLLARRGAGFRFAHARLFPQLRYAVARNGKNTVGRVAR